MAKGGVFALGNFDGVHRGHKAVIKAAIEKARGMGVSAHVLTLEPHPRSLFKPGIPPFRLTPAPVKARLLRELGAEDVIVVPFTPEFAQLPAPQFVERILMGEHGAQHAVAGFDFVFGHNRAGNMENLRTWLAPYGVGVTEVTPFRDAQGEVMSSSRVREALAAADLRTAEHILGRPWSITGTIIHGPAQEREVSVPKANIALADYIRPKFGVYAIQAGPPGGPYRHQGLANIGKGATPDGKDERLEFHLFDFHEEIYGQVWEIELLDFLRPEQAFAEPEALRVQILQDIETAKVRLSALAH